MFNESNSLYTFHKIYQCFRTLLTVNVSEYESKTSNLIFPKIPIPILSELCYSFNHAVAVEPVLLRLKGDFIIVGDLHGHILDLFRILKKFGHPPKTSYIFLGDIVDRGEFSTETLILIFLMKVLWPENTYIIRGNHEFSEMWKTHGFIDELELLYNESSVVDLFANAMVNLPMAAVINDKYLCVHGGIGPSTPNINELAKLSRPWYNFNSEPIRSILWSDPKDNVKTFEPSKRGSGFFFGAEALEDYLKEQNLELLIRGHEVETKGVSYSLNNKCVTVFSSSNYCGTTNNDAGILKVLVDGDPEAVIMSPLKYVLRKDASYLVSSSETSFLLSTKPCKLNAPPQQSFPSLNQNQSKVPKLEPLSVPNDIFRQKTCKISGTHSLKGNDQHISSSLSSAAFEALNAKNTKARRCSLSVSVGNVVSQSHNKINIIPTPSLDSPLLSPDTSPKKKVLINPDDLKGILKKPTVQGRAIKRRYSTSELSPLKK